MRCTRLLLVAGVGAAASVGTLEAAEGPIYTTEMRILRVPTTASRLQADSVAHKSGILFVKGAFEIRWGDDVLRSDGSGVRLNAFDISTRGSGEASDSRAAVYVVSSPDVSSPHGEPAGVMSGLPYTELQYMERDADGRFSLRPVEDIPQLRFDFETSRGDAPGMLRLKWRSELVRLGRRRPIPGVMLDIGKPEIIKLSGSSTDDVGIGQWCLLLFGEGEQASGLAILMRIRPAK
jgi:hypothetical protein